jgi:hypothetical protein
MTFQEWFETLDLYYDSIYESLFQSAYDAGYNAGANQKEAPPKREWVGLTDEERNKLRKDVIKLGDWLYDDGKFMKDIEAKLKEKNSD